MGYSGSVTWAHSFQSREYLSLDESSKPEMECPNLLLILYIPLFFRPMLISHLATLELLTETLSVRGLTSPSTLIERTKP